MSNIPPITGVFSKSPVLVEVSLFIVPTMLSELHIGGSAFSISSIPNSFKSLLS